MIKNRWCIPKEAPSVFYTLGGLSSTRRFFCTLAIDAKYCVWNGSEPFLWNLFCTFKTMTIAFVMNTGQGILYRAEATCLMLINGFHLFKCNIVSSNINAILDTHGIYHLSEVTIILCQLVKQLFSHYEKLLFHLLNKHIGHSLPPKIRIGVPLDLMQHKMGITRIRVNTLTTLLALLLGFPQ